MAVKLVIKKIVRIGIKRMKITEFIQEKILYLDGGMGTLLQADGLSLGELPERLNVTKPSRITEIHKAYFDAGSNVVCANTFGANAFKFFDAELEEIIAAAMENAKRAKAESVGMQEKWVALDIGPTGRMLEPYGDLDFEDAVEAFAKTVRLGVKYGAELIFIETMNDCYETKAAVLAAKENSHLPVFVSNAYGEDGKLMTGATPSAMVAMLEGLGVDAIGVNCSFGPKALMPVVEEYLQKSSLPILVKPNAGLPQMKGDKTVYDVLPDAFSEDIATLVQMGARAVGGCCGTTPDYIFAVTNRLKNVLPKPITKKNITCVSSYTHSVELVHAPLLIGERINPTGKKRFKQALRDGDIEYVLQEGLVQQEKGVHILDVNVGLPEIDEKEMLTACVCRLQEIIDLPLQIDTSSKVAMESALRRYNGKALINSVNGKAESLQEVLPLAKKYGGVVVALTLDENGIPATAEERLQIAKNILKEAEKYGLEKKDFIFDPLAMAVSADINAAKETLKAVGLIKNELGCHVSLGVSNVSFGLPQRDVINATFFALALGQGLSAAIMNPYSIEMMKTYYAYCALNGLDENCARYVNFAETLPTSISTVPVATARETAGETDLQTAVIKGLKDRVVALTEAQLQTRDGLDIVNEEIIPALNAVGEAFENKRAYLPQLLMSAEAAKAAFSVVKSKLPVSKHSAKCAFVIATVKGDIHDIGKNIVKLLLENYGFDVLDLGKDVPPEKIADAVVASRAPLAGLSALMTTTVPSMAETITLIRNRAPWCKVVVGGAVLNEEYAQAIGADKYAKDGMETVRYAESIFSSLNEK